MIDIKLVEIILFFAAVIILFQLHSWLEAKTDVEKERARALELVNDKLELEIEKLREEC